MARPMTDQDTSSGGPDRWSRFGAFPAAGAVIALFGGNLLAAGTLQGQPAIAAALQLILLGVFVAYCFARPYGGARLAAPVVGGGVVVGVLSAVAPLLALVVAIVALGLAFVIAARLDERDDQLRGRRRGQR